MRARSAFLVESVYSAPHSEQVTLTHGCKRPLWSTVKLRAYARNLQGTFSALLFVFHLQATLRSCKKCRLHRGGRGYGERQFIGAWVDQEQREQLAELARQEDRSVSSLISAVLWTASFSVQPGSRALRRPPSAWCPRKTAKEKHTMSDAPRIFGSLPWGRRLEQPDYDPN